ncbi:MAG: hypothetical protein ACI835_001713 [Planctomycetota bacterium]|jgi:hypothetical protein
MSAGGAVNEVFVGAAYLEIAAPGPAALRDSELEGIGSCRSETTCGGGVLIAVSSSAV